MSRRSCSIFKVEVPTSDCGLPKLIELVAFYFIFISRIDLMFLWLLNTLSPMPFERRFSMSFVLDYASPKLCFFITVWRRLNATGLSSFSGVV